MEEPQEMQIDGGKQGDEFYEEIEAPKFVDFTVPDQYCPDDRYWFCLRVGCDQKHEEEIDSEAIYKDFVLRVMAARSPNIRLRKALNRKAASGNVKCPLTAPPKSSRSRIPRLALISSVSQKVVHKASAATPDSKKKQPSDVSKAFTTPRNKKRLSNPNTFRSVRNPKATTIAVPKNRVVAKALAFNSPKKAVKTKTCSELNTPVRTICEAMKKLEITGGKKHVLGYDKSLPIGGASRKQLRGREVKSRVYDALNSRSRNVQEAKSSRCLKRKNNGKDIKPSCDHVPHEGDDDSSDMEIEEKSRNGSFEGCSGEANAHEECSETVKSQQGEHSVEVFSDASRGDIISLSSSEERDSGENEDPKSQAQSSVAEGTSEGSDREDKTVSSSGKEKIPKVKESDDKENILACDDTENGSEARDDDEKENALASDDNRVQNHNDGKHGNLILGKKEISKISKKVNRVIGKTLKEGSIPAASGSQGVKYWKPKPTNPKPFRLRTDERRILKEANLEKKILTPLSEITTEKTSQRKHLKKNERCRRKSENDCDIHEGGEKKLDRRTPENHSVRIGSTCLKHSKGEVERKLSPMTPCRRAISSHQKPHLVTSPMEREKAAQKLQNSLKKIKSPIIQQKLVRPSGAMSSRKETVSLMTPRQLSVINETSSKFLTPKNVAKPSQNAAPGTKASTRTASRSLSRGRRPATIPKEPIFHSIHVPKSCTRKQQA
ncbi:uncharacterized protein LOC132179171 isoform X2 [Corylus avellana]|uniref:uncharacterized protein LOC132179171 isoform X2 n=1 Tax=Corylus avellana TaxID=13451 RepID=UPI00286C359A|nr:uncharacterized protein LOC132179171 isoform X2 [Corylus avellana]